MRKFDVELLEDEDTVLTEEKDKNIILINDDHNTFTHVINCLMDYCKHSLEQAEQCAILTHYKGKCAVKKGSFDELRPICETLLDKGLTVKIE